MEKAEAFKRYVANAGYKFIYLRPFHPLLKTHKLKGSLKECYAFTVEYDLRIIFYFEDVAHAVFISLGTHDQVY